MSDGLALHHATNLMLMATVPLARGAKSVNDPNSGSDLLLIPTMMSGCKSAHLIQQAPVYTIRCFYICETRHNNQWPP